MFTISDYLVYLAHKQYGLKAAGKSVGHTAYGTVVEPHHTTPVKNFLLSHNVIVETWPANLTAFGTSPLPTTKPSLHSRNTSFSFKTLRE